MERLTLIMFVSVLTISIVAGVVDQRLFNGSVNLLNPAAALSTVVAFVMLVLIGEDSPKWYVNLAEASLLSALVLHALHLLSLAFVGVGFLPFGIGYVETYKVVEVINEPVKVTPFTIVARSISFDTVVLLLIYYLIKVKKVDLKSYVNKLTRRTARHS